MAERAYRTHPRLEDREPIRRCGWPECRAACCVYDTWVDEGEMDEILAHAHLVSPHLEPDRRNPDGWFGRVREPDEHTPRGTVLHTTVIENPGHYGGSACIFLMDDFRCALQVASEAAAMHPWRLKPFYCVLHPLDLDKNGRITLDETRHLIVEPASCVREGKNEVRLKELFAEELDYLIAGL